MYGSEGASGYVIPRYRAAGDSPWYHVLHGNIPGHQIDFMYCPEVPQGPLTTTHFSHLARLMKYIEPQTGATHAFAIGNLSRDDTQHEPGHGAVGVIFGFRIGGTVDHAGRGNPPFAHGIVAVDRDLAYTTLLEAAATFYRHVMNATEVNSSAGMFYREYVGAVREAPERVAHVLERYVEEFRDLPYLRQSGATWDWVADEGAQPKRVVIVHKHDEPFGAIAHAAAKIATVLYRSNIRWTSITTGREADIPGGVSVRFVRERDVTMEDRHGMVLRLDEVAEDEAEIARMFGARPQGEQEEKPQFGGGWRERFAAQQAGGAQPLSQTFGGGAAVRAPAPPERARATTPSSPPSQRSAGWGDVHAPGVALGAAAAGVAGAAQQVGPKGTLVIDTEKLLGPGVAPGRAPVGAKQVAPTSAPPPAVLPAQAVQARSEMADEIPVIVEKPASSRKWVWAIVGLGCAGLAALAAVWALGIYPVRLGQGGADGPAPSGAASPPDVSPAPPASSAPAATSSAAAQKQEPAATPPEPTQENQEAGEEQPAQVERGKATGTAGASTAKPPLKRRTGNKTPPSRGSSATLPEEKIEF
ncbi:hypothetical protein [Sorangium sp. So ce131]|uniref:hypothetical protein n=1 Tax=Sorangium sp. So ce131 TaxID=3133282 RepID=UPI003F620B55